MAKITPPKKKIYGSAAPTAQSSLDKKPGTLSQVNARVAGEAAQPLQEAKNQMRNAEMSPAQMSYALANQVAPPVAQPGFEITGSPAFNAKLQQAQAQPNPTTNYGINPNLPPPPFNTTAAPAAAIPTNPINSAAGQAQQPGLVQRGINKLTEIAFPRGITTDEYGNPAQSTPLIDAWLQSSVVIGKVGTAIQRTAGGAISKFGGIKKTEMAAAKGSKEAQRILDAVKKYNIAAENAAKGTRVAFAGAKPGEKITEAVKEVTSKPGVKEPARGMSVKAQRILKNLLTKEVTNTKTIMNKDVETGITSATEISTTTTKPRFEPVGKLAKWILTVGLVYVAGTMGFSLFQKAEAIDKGRGGTSEVSWIAKEMGLQAKDYAEYQEASALYDDVLNTEIGLVDALTFKGTRLNIETAKRMKTIVDAAMQDRAMAVDMGETEEMMWARINADKIADEIWMTDYKNSERLRVEELLREAQREDMHEQAKFWLNYKRELLAMEAEDRRKQAEFWAEYKKIQMEISKASQDNSRSNLNFGLLR